MNHNAHFISLRNVNLYYPAVAYKERSLKALLTQLIPSKVQRSAIHNVHALKNVSLEIKHGERVGLLGHNGAGKSTLLKTLSGLYPISSGYLNIQGQVRALFSLDLGFEPDASGRKNILYRGLLLGLSPKFIREKEQEIIAFADLGEFIDYPIKVYSAGMQIRLAFAISTIVDGDILLLDEVIGAGDASFIQKAKARLQSLIARSKILLLASHDFAALTTLCERGLVFHHGALVFDGPIDQSITYYKKINELPS